jgi:CRISPR-associated endoribonuclease Cas6
VSVNHAYHLAALIYQLLAHASSEYATFLHRQGYGEGARRFKLFTFSPLLGGPRQITGETLRFDTARLEWYIASPIEPFLLHLVHGLLEAPAVQVGGAELAVAHVETLPEPLFTREMRLTCLAPITMSTRTAEQRWAQYLTPDDPRFAAAIGANLERKYKLVQRLAGPAAASFGGEAFTLIFDPDYVARHGGKISKLIDYKSIKIRGYLAPLTVLGPPELIHIGYECGFGDKNSQGFGMVQVARRHPSENPQA